MIKYAKLPENIEDNFTALIDLFSKDKNIVFAYIFGGMARKKQSPLSDIDIAVYLAEPDKLDYLSMYSEVTETLKTDEVDLVVLNNAKTSLAGRVLQNRKILVDKEPFLRHKYESLTLRKFFDFKIKESAIIARRFQIG
ncbi:MAG: nucleotidyltransferase domain-containing protein [Nitrospira sp.]|nr:nucleotidyltransferase domain-containing protein [bacterium]MBL7050240.1 nucleotidyltransferase domain-containing protein [Nitrospira sp.]